MKDDEQPSGWKFASGTGNAGGNGLTYQFRSVRLPCFTVRRMGCNTRAVGAK